MSQELRQDAPLSVHVDRIGATYIAGEKVTGCVVVNYATASTFVSIDVTVLGILTIESTIGGCSDLVGFNQTLNLKPLVLMNLRISLHSKGHVLPAGKTELPFLFGLKASNPDILLIETYNGVCISCSYTLTATARGIMGKSTSDSLQILVIVPGQVLLLPHVLKEDKGVNFELNEEGIEEHDNIGRMGGLSFLLEGNFERYYNDVDIPISGWIVVRRCNVRILSIELQLLRVEHAATTEVTAHKATEVQRIQVADGDVLHNLDIPIYMFFPRWYTCPSIKTSNLRIVFDVNIKVLLECRQVLSKVVPIYLYRASN
ncbi:Vacuolar protein sorting protein 26 related [Trypanosoma melophagium]|uniref:Vacuolar protein sorting protein 26 related n=1 Tax=Trypanosoma melophagium TaxID=715481 RepID=UPI00351A08A4|nr:Vacuolar protein sorting protein 26 related [Trypanosoma melophagium]